MITSAFCTHKCNIFRMVKYFYDNVKKTMPKPKFRHRFSYVIAYFLFNIPPGPG